MSNPTSKNKNNTFFGGAAILAAGIVIVKLIGALYKIPLGNILGEAGFSDFNTAYYIYSLLITVSTGGLPVALSKMISEAHALGRHNQVQKTFRVAFLTFLALGTISFCLMFFFPQQLANLMNNSRSWYSIRALAPAIFFLCPLSAMRGYFQGHSIMTPTAVSQIIEALSKLVIGLTLAYFLLQSILAFFYREAPDLCDKDLPRCTVIVPAFNEGKYVATTLMSVLDSDYPAEKLEVIAVNDGSKDDTWDWICKAADLSNGRITTKNLLKNGGKRRALYEGIKIATGEVIVTIDSDSAITRDALRKIASPFANPAVGAVAGNIRVTNRGEGIIPKMLDVAFAFGFEFIRCAQSIIGSVLCTPGALSAYRLAAIQPLMDEWVNQTFMGRPSGMFIDVEGMEPKNHTSIM